MAIDVLLELDVLRHTLPILVADAQKAHSGKLDAEPVCARLRETRAIVAELIATLKQASVYIDDESVFVLAEAAIARAEGRA